MKLSAAQLTEAKKIAESGDSQAVNCPKCKGLSEHPLYPSQPCDQCQGTGFLLQQRRDEQGTPVRVSKWQV